MKKTFEISIPDYLTIGQYQKLMEVRKASTSRLEEVVGIIHSVTDISIEDIRSWDANSLVKVSGALNNLTDVKNEFHPLVEFDGVLYGFSALSKSTLGEYIDLENLSKEPVENLHEIAALLYRPMNKHRFDTLKFAVKQKIKTVVNKTDNPFRYYELESYSSDTRMDNADKMKEFPAHVILGALNFTTATGLLYLNDIQYSNQILSKEKMESNQKLVLDLLSQDTGDGLVPSSTFQSPTYSASQGINPSLN